MPKTRVVIMSFKGRSSVTYSDDGQFIYVPREKHHRIGQVLFVREPAKITPRYIPGWKTLLASAAVIILILGLYNPFAFQPAEAYFSLGLDTGNAELWLDKHNRVVEVKYTGAGELEALRIEGKDVYLAISEIAAGAQKAGLLDEAEAGFILMNYADMSKNGNHHLNEDKAKEAVTNTLNGDSNSPLIIMSSHEKGFMTKAGEMGLTASQYYVLEQSANQGISITAEQLKNGPVSKALHESGTTPAEMFGMAARQPDMELETHRDMMPVDNESAPQRMPGANHKPQSMTEQESQAEPFTSPTQMHRDDATGSPEYSPGSNMEQNMNAPTMNKHTREAMSNKTE